MLAAAQIEGWQLVVVISIAIFGFVALFNGEWPWQGIITHNHYECPRHDEDENDPEI